MSNDDTKARDRIEILGQVFCYPSSLWGVLSVACIVAGICFIIWAVLRTPRAVELIGNQFSVYRASADKTEVASSRFLMAFWTPSAKTKQASDVEDWERMDSDDKLDDFAKQVMADRRVRGYRRYEVIGHGISQRRPGMWWVVTVSDDYDPTDLVRVYQGFWKFDKSIYMEILRSGSGGSYFK